VKGIDGVDEFGEDEVIVEFFGQLWAIDSPLPPPSRNPSLIASIAKPNSSGHLFWVQNDLFDSRVFTAWDCFPVRRGDRLDKSPMSFSFAKDVWSAEQGK
jgi:hypothetical protein